MRLVLIAGAIAAFGGASSAQVELCLQHQAMHDMTECMRSQAGQADAELREAWSAAMEIADARMDTEGLAALERSQRDWLAFRDAACQSEARMLRVAEMQPMVVANCRQRLSRDRVRDLRMLVEMQ